MREPGSTAVLLLASAPATDSSLQEWARLAKALATTWQQVIIPCPLDRADALLYAVRDSLTRGVQRIVALPLQLSAVRLRAGQVAEQFRALGRCFPATTFHIAQTFGPAQVAQAVVETTRHASAPGKKTTIVLVGHGSDAARQAELAGLARWVFEVGGTPVEYAFDSGAAPDLPTVLRHQARLGVESVVLTAGEWFIADARWASVVEPVARSLGISVAHAEPFWKHETVTAALRERCTLALKDLSLVPKLWEEVTSEVNALGADEERQLNALREKIDGILPPPTEESTVLLQPSTLEQASADAERYRGVLAEVEAGVRVATSLPTVASKAVGWLGVQCSGEEMAVWLLRAIIVDNVMVRREGSVLYLPSSPTYTPGDVRRLVAVVARAMRYWALHSVQRG